MTVAHGTYRGGSIELDAPVDWPDGLRVAVVQESSSIGLRENEWPDTPEAREELIARIESFEPLETTPEDELEIAQAREEVRRITLEAVRRQMGLQIAAVALSLGNCTVVTKDSDFAAIPGLTVENWSDSK